MFRLEKGLKTDSKEFEGERCVRGNDRKPCLLSEKGRGRLEGLYGNDNE